MDLDELHGRFLDELYRQTKGDTAAKVSMYEVGAALGLGRDEAGGLAQDLVVDGLADLKTLAGGIGITDEGLSRLGFSAPAPAPAAAAPSLGRGPVASDQDRGTIADLIREIKAGISDRVLAYEFLEQIVLDLKTMEVHLLSPKPKTAVLRELLRSLEESLAAAGIKKTAAKLKEAAG